MSPTTLITAGIALAMLYTGMLFNWPRLRASVTPQSLRAFCGLAVLNYFVVPLATWCFFRWSGPDRSALQLALLILAVLPCAPLVPAIVSLVGEPPEWSLFVFLGFSLLSLVFTVVLTVLMARHAQGADLFTGLLHYLAGVYGPMLLGQLLSLSKDAWVAVMLRVMRPVAAVALLTAVGLFALAHRAELAAITWMDLAVMVLFQGFCVLVALPLGERYGGSRLTRLITSGFRNFALAIAFAAVVLDRPDVSAYVVVFSAVTLPVCAVTCLLARPRSSRMITQRILAPGAAASTPTRKR